MYIVCCQVEVSATVQSLVQRILPTVVCLSVHDLYGSAMRRHTPEWGCCATGKTFCVVYTALHYCFYDFEGYIYNSEYIMCIYIYTYNILRIVCLRMCMYI